MRATAARRARSRRVKPPDPDVPRANLGDPVDDRAPPPSYIEDKCVRGAKSNTSLRTWDGSRTKQRSPLRSSRSRLAAPRVGSQQARSADAGCRWHPGAGYEDVAADRLVGDLSGNRRVQRHPHRSRAPEGELCIEPVSAT